MIWLLSGPQGVYLLDFFCSSVQLFFTVKSLFLLHILYLDLYVLGDDALII